MQIREFLRKFYHSVIKAIIPVLLIIREVVHEFLCKIGYGNICKNFLEQIGGGLWSSSAFPL